MGYEWGSVKEFDDEFRHIQALYHYPWTYEPHHLHTTRLQAKTQKPQAQENRAKGKSAQAQISNNTAPYTSDSRVICRSYNTRKGLGLGR